MDKIRLCHYKKKIEQLKRERVMWKRIKRARGGVINLPKELMPEISKAISYGYLEALAEKKKQEIADKINYYEDKIHGRQRVNHT